MLSINGVFKMISVKASGVAKNGSKYANILAVDFFNQPTEEERKAGVKCQFFMLKAFGNTADFIIRNFNDTNGTRRAFVSGEIQLDSYKAKMNVTKQITFNGQDGSILFDVDVDKISVAIIVKDVNFLDKSNAKVNTTEFIPTSSNKVVFTVIDPITTTDNKPAGEHLNTVERELQQAGAYIEPDAVPAD